MVLVTSADLLALAFAYVFTSAELHALVFAYESASANMNILTSDLSLPFTMDSKTASHHDTASSMLDVWDGVLGIIGSLWFPLNMASLILAKKFNFAFIGPYNPFPKLNSFVKMVFGKH